MGGERIINRVPSCFQVGFGNCPDIFDPKIICCLDIRRVDLKYLKYPTKLSRLTNNIGPDRIIFMPVNYANDHFPIIVNSRYIQVWHISLFCLYLLPILVFLSILLSVYTSLSGAHLVRITYTSMRRQVSLSQALQDIFAQEAQVYVWAHACSTDRNFFVCVFFLYAYLHVFFLWAVWVTRV